jgi:hypothetical protein
MEIMAAKDLPAHQLFQRFQIEIQPFKVMKQSRVKIMKNPLLK